jgi:hypothetical protein
MTSRRDFLWLAAACGFTASAHAGGARHTVAQSKAGKIGGVREHGVYGFRGVPLGWTLPRGGERRLFAQVPYIQRGTY